MNIEISLNNTSNSPVEVKRVKHIMFPELAEGINFQKNYWVADDLDKTMAEKKAIYIVNNIKPELRTLCYIANYHEGTEDQYLSSIISVEDIDKLEFGKSVMIISPTGSGKTKVIQNIILHTENNVPIVYLTNRSACETQFRKDLLKNQGYKDIPENFIKKISVDDNDNIKIMTYQRFLKICNNYRGTNVLLILDECHALAEDSVFSIYGQKIIEFLRTNLDNTKRIYITATPNDIIDTITTMEKVSDIELPETITPETSLQEIYSIPINNLTRIQDVYYMKTNWSYLKFQLYNPNDKDKLVNYIKKANKNNIKSLIYINDISKGKELQEVLGDCQHVYSDEDKKTELNQIAIDEKFLLGNLVTTKVAENGISLHDDKLGLIVAETWDLTTLQQIIGRARVNRKSPHNLTILIPDYSSSDIGTIMGKVYSQLNKIRKVNKNPEMCMESADEYSQYIYYSAIKGEPIINELALETLSKQYKFLFDLKQKEEIEPHAFARKVLETYGFDYNITDDMFIDYDNISNCKNRIITAWNVYKSSNLGEDDLKELKNQLKMACNETGAYGKTFDSNIQIDTINDILAFADISEHLKPKRIIFDFE